GPRWDLAIRASPIQDARGRSSLLVSQPVRVVLAGVLFLLATQLGVALEFADEATTFRAASGVALAVVLLWGYGVLPAIFAIQLVVGLRRGSPLAAARAMGVAATLSAFVGAYAVRRIVGPESRFDRVRDVLVLLVVAVV